MHTIVHNILIMILYKVSAMVMGMHSILAERSVSITELRKNPGQYFLEEPVAVLSNNRPTGYMIGQELFQELMKLVEQVEGKRTVTGRFRMSTDDLREIGRRGTDLLAYASPEEMEEYSRWSKSTSPD